MDEKDFEGTQVLEKEAVDSDNFGKVKSLLKQAQIDSATISQVLKMISEGS